MPHSISRRRFLSLTAGSLAIAPLAPAIARETRGLIVHTDVPMNAEPALANLVGDWQTPTDQFYIRSHAPIPQIDADQYRLKVTGLVDQELSLSLEQLQGLQQQTIMATMTCAGNRRYEHSRVSPVSGVPWREGAIGNARWSGVPLWVILRQAGIQESARHVWFDGLDEIERDNGIIGFGASIPLGKALDDTAAMPGALVCTHMNDQPLSPDHGWPVRTVVPGYIGARSVKWLGRIVVSDRPSPNHYLATAYKLVTEGSDLEWAEAGPIYRYPINCVICTPAAGSDHRSGWLDVSGYALPPGQAGRTIQRVNISTDEGHSWTSAKLTPPQQDFCWQLWSASIPVKGNVRSIMAWAIDSAGNEQPASVDWNLKGYLFNARHQVPIRVTS